MASKATIEQFDGGDFSQYRERLEFYFCANGIGEIASNASNSEKLKEEKKMTAHLVSLLSKTVYSTFKTLCLPKSPSDYKYAQIPTFLQDHYKTKTSRTTATHRFRQCTQNSTEAVTEFSHRLKNIAVDCQFGTHLDRALSDQFVTGLRDLSVRKLILSKTDTDVSTFDKKFQIALTEETAVKFASMMEQEPQSTPVHKLHSSKSKKPTYHRSQSSSRPPRTKGMCRFPSITDHRSTKQASSGSWMGALISSRHHLNSLPAFFKVVDHTTEYPEDRLKKVRYLSEAGRDSGSALFRSDQDVSVDKRIVRSKARYLFRQYLPNKPVHWGTKIFAACDHNTSYCFNYSIYTAQEINGQTDIGDMQCAVQDLTGQLHHQGHVVYTENFYTSGKLTGAPLEDGLHLAGTIKLNRTGVPQALKDLKAFDKYAKWAVLQMLVLFCLKHSLAHSRSSTMTWRGTASSATTRIRHR